MLLWEQILTQRAVNEGFDSANVDCVVLARLTESEIVFVQQMGRGTHGSALGDSIFFFSGAQGYASH